MISTRRTDIFGRAPRQHDLFGVAQEPFDEPMTVEKIRQKLTDAVALLRRSVEKPWSTALPLRIAPMFLKIASKLAHDKAAALAASFNAQMKCLYPGSA